MECPYISLSYIHVPWTIAGGQHGCDAFGMKRTYSWLEGELESVEGGVKKGHHSNDIVCFVNLLS